MSIEEERAERDDRTIFISGITEKVTDKLLYELFHQSGPIERVSIPKEKDGKNKTFGFVTYVHEVSVAYALNIYAGTKLFGRELLLKYRNSNKNNSRNSLDQINSPMQSNQSPMSSIVPGFQQYLMPQLPMQAPIFTQDMFQQQLLQMASAPDFSFNNFPSARQDNVGSHRERPRDDRNDREFVDRNRHHREENRNNRSRPYDRRSRSRSPQQRNHRDRERNRDHDRDRRRGGNGGGNYNRWKY